MVRTFLLLALAALVVAPSQADAQRRRDAPLMLQEGGESTPQLRPYREIVDGVRRRMGDAKLIGTDFDRQAGTYRLRFMRDGEVIFVDVDGQTGEIIGRSDR